MCTGVEDEKLQKYCIVMTVSTIIFIVVLTVIRYYTHNRMQAIKSIQSYRNTNENLQDTRFSFDNTKGIRSIGHNSDVYSWDTPLNLRQGRYFVVSSASPGECSIVDVYIIHDHLLKNPVKFTELVQIRSFDDNQLVHTSHSSIL
jgi:hypothetical protein